MHKKRRGLWRRRRWESEIARKGEGWE